MNLPTPEEDFDLPMPILPCFSLVPQQHTRDCEERWEIDGECTCGNVIGWMNRYTNSEGDLLPRSMLRKVRNIRRKEGYSDSVYLVVQEIARRYGGPEEGGWWFDWAETIKVIELNPSFCPGYPFWRLLLNTMRWLRREYPQPRYNRFSMANRREGDYIFLLLHHEKQIPDNDRERPRYE